MLFTRAMFIADAASATLDVALTIRYAMFTLLFILRRDAAPRCLPDFRHFAAEHITPPSRLRYYCRWLSPRDTRSKMRQYTPMMVRAPAMMLDAAMMFTMPIYVA